MTNPMPENDTVTIKGKGTAMFGDITFNEPGTYIYKVTEKTGDNDEYTYDKTVYTVIFDVESKEEPNNNKNPDDKPEKNEENNTNPEIKTGDYIIVYVTTFMIGFTIYAIAIKMHTKEKNSKK